MPISYLEYSSACTAPKTLKERVWAWPRHTASSRTTEAASGRKPNWTREQPFISHLAPSRNLSYKTQPPQPEDNHEFERRHTLGGRQSGRHRSRPACAAPGEVGQQHLRRPRRRGSLGFPFLPWSI